MKPSITQSAKPGPNHTVTFLKPDEIAAMESGFNEFPPTSEGVAEDIAAVRVQYAKEGIPFASLPTAGVEKIADPATLVFMDKLGERLGFERTGTRLYDGLVSKHKAYGSFPGGPTAEELYHHREEELEHFHLLVRAVEAMGGDPNAVTPSADLAASASRGIYEVIVDPRTTLLQSLEAMLIAELVDNDCWDGLVTQALALGHEELAGEFTRALAEEAEHLADVRRWVAAGQGRPDPADTSEPAAATETLARTQGTGRRARS